MSHGAVESQGLVALLAGQLSPDLIHRAATQLGENDERTRSAVSAGIPSVLATLSDVAGSPAGANRLSSIINRVEVGSEGATAAARLGSAAGRDEGVVLFDAEAGGRAGPIADAIARSSGVRPDSAHKLLGGLTGAAVVTMRRSYGQLAPETLQSVLGQQRAEFVRRLPDPLASVFDGGRARAVETTTERAAAGPAIRELAVARRSRGGALPIAILASIFLIGLWLLRGIHRPRGTALPVSERPVPTQTHPALRPGTPRPAPPSSDTLANFLAGPGRTPARFTLEPLNFEFGSALPTQASMKTIDQVASTLNEFPGTTIRVESFTDNIGGGEANLQLSEARSKAVKDLLVQRGVPSSRSGTQGMGEANPLETNDTTTGRATNRRTEIVVTSR